MSIGKLDMQAKKFQGEEGLRLLDSPHRLMPSVVKPSAAMTRGTASGLKTPQWDDIRKLFGLFNSGQLYVTWRSAVM